MNEAIALVTGIGLLEVPDQIADIIDVYLKNHLMPQERVGDALHLALASYHKCDFLLAWNCRHISQRQQVRAYTHPQRPPGAVRAGTGNPDGVMRGGNPMKDEALERVWASREAISRRCGYDSRRLVRYLQQRKERREAGPPLAPDRDATAAPLR